VIIKSNRHVLSPLVLENSPSLVRVMTRTKRQCDKPNSQSPFAKCENWTGINPFGKNNEGSVKRANVLKNRSARLKPNSGEELRQKDRGSNVKRPNVRHARSKQKLNDVMQRKGDDKNSGVPGNGNVGSPVHGRVIEPWNDTRFSARSLTLRSSRLISRSLLLISRGLCSIILPV
jgi:hypothetical protein